MKFKYFLLLFILTSCFNENKTIFGGKVINTTSEYISIYKDDNKVDETFIDNLGYFEIILDSIKPGLYSFYHQPEFQHFILDKFDNLMIRLNTLDFDESLVYTGKGSSKNNFLMDVFLRNERDEVIINSNLDNSVTIFKKLIDSLYNNQYKFYKEFRINNNVSKTTNDIIESAILYPYLSKYHSYFIRNNLNENDQNYCLSDYKKKISFNNENLTHFKPYIDFIYLHIYNDVKNNNNFISLIDFNKLRLLKTDEMIQSSTVKSRVLRFHAIGFLLQREKDSTNNQFINIFNEVSKDKKLNLEIYNLYNEMK